MKVTNLKSQLRDENRVNVFIDDKYRFSLDIFQVAELGIKVGLEISESDAVRFEVESQFGKLYSQALEYCLMRPHSAREVKDYLFRKTLTRKYLKQPRKSQQASKPELVERPGVSKAVTERVFQRLVDKGYVDDEKFARYWFENRSQAKGVSLRKLRLELAQKGIDRAIIESLAAESIRQDSTELQKVIAKKQKRYPDHQKFIQYLMRQGFRYDEIESALNEALDL